MSFSTPQPNRSARSTPGAAVSGFTPPAEPPIEEVVTDGPERTSESDSPAHIQPTPSRDSTRNRPMSRGNHAAKNSGRAMSLDSELFMPSSGAKGSRHYRDEWDPEFHADPRDYPSGGYGGPWREFPRDRYTRRSHYSRPPPAILNRKGSVSVKDEDDYMHSLNDDTRALRDPFENPNNTRRRIFDEEMGYQRRPSHTRKLSMTTSNPVALGNGRLDWNNLTPQEKREVLRLPFTHWMHTEWKNHFVASLGEFVGTTMFLFFAFAGTEVANIQSNAGSQGSSNENTTTGGNTGFDVATLLYISLCFGFSLMVNVWVFFRISGGLFNPAVTLAMIMVQGISIIRGICLFIAQLAGGMLASVLVRYLFPESFNVRTTLGGNTSLVQGVFIEALLTAELVFAIFMLAKEKHRATFIAPVGIGLALFISEMAGVQFTGGSLNPARSFGPCAITGVFDNEHWIYWVGPFLGSVIAVVFYRFIKTLEYEMANPGADGDDLNDPTKNPEKREEIRLAKTPSILSGH